MPATGLPWHVLRFLEQKGRLVELPSLEILRPLIETLIIRDSLSTSVRNGLCAHSAEHWGSTLSHRRANRLLKGMLDEGLLYRVEHGGCMFYAVDSASTLGQVVA